MQLSLKRFALGFVCLIFISTAFSQDSNKVKKENIEVNFLSSYYWQSGIHSPVTGGRGTEKLSNIAPTININIPLDSSKTLNLDVGVDFYSSASSDNINNPYLDPSHVSGASAKDSRSYVTASYKIKKKNQEIGLSAGTSIEWDVFSYSGGLSYAIDAKDKNKGLSIDAKYYFDDWKLIYPVELRNGTKEYLNTDKRQSVNTSLNGYLNLSKKIATSLTFDFVLQNGLLSTPFHRVYFSDQELPKIEQLPNQRIKYPVGLKLNYHINEFLISKIFYRYYSDSWGLTGNTFEIELPIKLSQTLRIYPFYRLHIQEGAKYFADYKVHISTQALYTSDYDLSTFTSNKIGGGVAYSPLFGLFRFKYGKQKHQLAVVNQISLRYAYYSRSDGLSANVFTFGLKAKFKQ